uniref:Uncharacterized protein n=1 Tax=Megaselia scalaris TaxID=36166 RepID=T1GA25_MEGSC
MKWLPILKRFGDIAQEVEVERSSESAKSEEEEGEIEEEEQESNHPLVSVTKVDPTEIPEVSNKFLMRNDGSDRRRRSRSTDRKGRDRSDERNRNRAFGWTKKLQPKSRSGRIVKGRGVFRYRTPSRSRSKSRDATPPHWRQAAKRTIKLSDLEKMEEEKKMRDEEIKRREVERKKRHEEMARNPKKSFYEFNHSYESQKDLDTSKEETEDVDSKRNRKRSVDMNALDYEAHSEDEDKEKTDERAKDKPENGKVERKRSRSRSRSRRRSRSPRDRRTIESIGIEIVVDLGIIGGQCLDHHGETLVEEVEVATSEIDETVQDQWIDSEEIVEIVADGPEIADHQEIIAALVRDQDLLNEVDEIIDPSHIPVVENKQEDAKEKMAKRAVALEAFKDHMRKEIAREEEKRAEKKRLDEMEMERTNRELAELEKKRAETLQKLEEHENLKKLAAVRKVLESGLKKKDDNDGDKKRIGSSRKNKRSKSSSSSSSSGSSSD